jgi:integrase
MATGQRDKKTTRSARGGGSVKERSPGVWRLRYMSGGRQVQSTFHGSKARANAELRRLIVLGGGRPPEAEKSDPKAGRTVGSILDKWLEHQSAPALERSPRTIDAARLSIEGRLRPAFGDILADQVTAEHIDAAYRQWATRDGLSGGSIRRHHAVLSAALRFGVRRRWLAHNVAVDADPPSARVSRKLVTPTVENVGQLIRAAEEREDPVMAAAIALAYVTGARRGELSALTWSDVDVELGRVRIERSLVLAGGEWVEKGMKSGRDRIISIDPRAVQILAALKEQAGDSDRVIPLDPNMITDRFASIRSDVELDGVRFHDLRHASATEQIGRGVPVTTVSARLGHATSRTTLDRYAHALPAGDVAGAEVMGGLLPA